MARRLVGAAAVVKILSHTITLASGDVRALRLVRDGSIVRFIVCDDEDVTEPLIEARLNEAEQKALRKALAPHR